MRNRTKKLVSSLAIVALLFGMLPMSIVNAATATMNSASAYAGETVSISYKLGSDLTMKDAELLFTYDSSKLEFVSITKDTSAPGQASKTIPKIALLDFSTGGEFNVPAGNVATATFKILEGTTGSTTVSAEMLYTDTAEDLISLAANTTVTAKVAVNSISLNKTEVSMNKGEKTTLVATLDPSTATDTVAWSSSNTSVVTVSNGELTAVGSGTATITAKAGGKEATCKVTVYNPITSVSLDKTEMYLVKGQTGELKVSYLPVDTTSATSVKWTSTNQSVATVKDGIVTAVNDGTAIICAEIAGIQATCTVTVTDIPLEGIELNKKDFDLYLGESETLTVIYNPDNTTDDKTVTWTTSNEDVVTVENGKVTAVALGSATITAKVGNYTATVVITVPEVLIEGITLTAPTTKLEVGETTQLTLTISPENYTEEVKATYTSSDESIVTVDENGKVTAVAVGKAEITVSVNGSVETTLTFEVAEKVDEPSTEGSTDAGNNGTGTTTGSGNKAPSVLPATGDIAIGTMVVMAVVSLAGIVLFVKKNRK